MEPLDPSLRDALKQEHPELTDETIDRVEELLALRFQIDTETEPQRLEQIDRERIDLVQREIPRFDEVLQKVRAQDPGR
jgi:hypothetical protein